MTEQYSPRILQAANVIAVLLTLVTNALANILPIAGVNTGQVADNYVNLFTPPGYVFSIWGVIYVLLAVFMVYQVQSNQRDADYLQKIGWLFLIGGMANAVWIIVFHYSVAFPVLLYVSVIPIVILLVSLLLIYIRLDIGINPVSRGVRLGIHLPISVYLGWISLATIANIASALNVAIPGISLLIQELATAAMVLVAFLLTSLMIFKRRELAFSSVVIWASVGIAIKGLEFWSSTIITAAALSAVILTAIALVLIPLVKKESLVDYYRLTTT